MAKQQKNDAFQTAVLHTAEISTAYCPGLQALSGRNSSYVTIKDHAHLEGSVDIDSSLQALYPHASRWDYAIGCDRKAYFVEIHPASTSSVDDVVKKVVWLKDWLKNKAPELKKIAAGKEFYWIPSGRYDILPNSLVKRRLAQHNICIVSKPMVLPREEAKK